nr:hypothetical protein [Tanacetum cinerariifolium]
MESSSSNSEERGLQLMQLEERKLHSNCMAWFKGLKYLDVLVKLIDEKVLKYEELRMKEREVQEIQEIEKQMKEREIQQQESLVTEGTTFEANLCTDDATLEACLFTEGIALDDNLITKESTNDYVTSLEQLDESSSLGNDAAVEKILVDTV